MKGFVILLIVVAALLTAGALVRGIVLMASGKDVTGRQSNRMMWYRVMFQGITILLVVILLALFGGSR